MQSANQCNLLQGWKLEFWAVLKFQESCLMRKTRRASEDSESASPWGFESIFPNFQTLDFGVEGSCREPEFSRRTRGSRNAAVAFFQRRFNHFLLLPHEGDIEPTGS